MSQVPQPHPSRITPFAGHAIVVGITARQPEVVVLTALELARALGAKLYFAYADPGRVVFVGDSVEADVAGARAVGMRTILVRTPENANGDDGGASTCSR